VNIKNLMVVCFSWFASCGATFADGDKMSLPDDMLMANVICGGNRVVAEANTRTTTVPTIYILDQKSNSKKKEIRLKNDVCYGELRCVTYKNNENIVILEDSACGGNAVEPSYVLVNAKTFVRTTVDGTTARKTGL